MYNIEDGFICPECGYDDFKKDHISGRWYCQKCGRIILLSDILDDYNFKSWKDRNYRPNAWNICYVNNDLDFGV